MRAWFWTILLLTAAVFLAVVIHSYPGNVLVVVGQWRVQVSLAFAILLSVAGFALIYFLIRLLTWLTQVPGRYRDWRIGRREKFEQSKLELGWVSLLEGRYEHAEKVLGKLADDSRDPRRGVLSQISAARAAHELGDRTRRDAFISKAQSGLLAMPADRSMNIAVAVAAADLWLDDGQAQRALDALSALHADADKHVHMMRLLLKAYELLGLHEKVLETVRQMVRRQVFTEEQARLHTQRAAVALLRQSSDKDQWQAVWKSLRPQERLLPEVTLVGAAGLQSQGQAREASRLLEDAIKESFDGRLLAAYARADGDQVNLRLQKAEGWLTQRPEDPDLLTALGALCLAAQMWGQAQRYLEQSSRLRSDARVHSLLGSLYDRIGKPQMAANHWRLATAVSAALPVLAQDVHLPAADLASDPKIHHVEGLIDSLENNVERVDDAQRPIGEGGPQSDARASATDATTDRPRTAAASTQTVDDYHEFFDSAPIPFDGSPALVTTRNDVAGSSVRSSDADHQARQ